MNDKYKMLVEKLSKDPANTYSIQEAELLADKVLEISGYANQSIPIPILKIIRNFDFNVLSVKNIPDDISGNIFIGGSTSKYYDSNQVIVVGDNEVLQHQRFIFAHELAHYLLDYLGNEDYANNKIFSRAYLKMNHDDIEEVRADRFAAEILMPKKIFIFEYAKAMKKSNYNKVYTLNYLSKLFNTKISCINRRIQEVID